MLPEERHQAMVELINAKGSVRVKELSQVFEVTEETVRRDLDIPYFERESENVAEKKAIRFIEPGNRIALDASTTAWYVALQMPNIQITVFTNSLKVAGELARRDKIEVISTGGIVSTESLSCVGPLTEETLESFHVNKAFLSCKGLHTEYGVSEGNELQAVVKRRMMDIADKIYILADTQKYKQGTSELSPTLRKSMC